MVEAPLVSIIIAHYNREQSLYQAIDSVYGQSESRWELLVVDDGSPPALQQRLSQKYASAEKCRLILLPQRLGFPGAVRNVGIKASRGSFVSFLDSDDVWHPDKLKMQLLRPGTVNHCREIWWRYSGTLTQAPPPCWDHDPPHPPAGVRCVSQQGQRHRRAGDLFVDSLSKCILGPSTVLINRQFLRQWGLFREDLQVAEDYELWLRLTAHSTVHFLDKGLVLKRDHPADNDQLSHRYPFVERFRLDALEGVLRWPGLPAEKHAAVGKALVQKCVIWAQGAEKRGRKSEARQYRSKARRYQQLESEQSQLFS